MWGKHTVKTNYLLLKQEFETVKTTDPKQPTFKIF